MTDDPDIADDQWPDLREVGPPVDPGPLSGSLDLADVVGRVLETLVPAFADTAAVFVLEQLLSGDQVPTQAGGDLVVVRRLGTGFADAGRVQADPAFPAGEVIAFLADSPPACCMHLGRTLISSVPDGATLGRMRPGARQVLRRYTSFLAVPMTTHGSPAGFLALARTPGMPAFRDHDRQTAAQIAARAAASIDGCLTILRHRSAAARAKPGVAATATPPAPSRVEIAGRCLPATGYDIGGDWYDIVSLPAQRTGLIVGDVMGHGTQAATVMAQLSVAARALADLDGAPAEVLWRLNRTVEALPDGTLATCAYAIIDPDGQSCAIATAGHLPPVLAMPDGTTRIPELPGGPTLGIGAASYGQARIKLQPGTILALYTDGLVETRTRPFSQGILALRSVLARRHEDLDAACDALIESLGEHHEDDLTVLLARVPPSNPG